MFSGVSGLRSHQTMMDVVGNNIANVNTTGYKSSSVVFADTLSQLTQTSGAPQGGTGGTNPSQVGLGVRVQGISQNFTTGSAQATGKATNLMLDNDGMFVIQKGDATVYTRAGNFELDSQGSLVTVEGGYVQGWRADAAGQVNINGPVERIIINSDNVLPATVTSTLGVKGNIDKSAAPIATTAGGATTWKTPDQTSSFDVFDAQGKATRVTATFVNNPAAGSVNTSAAGVKPGDSWTITYNWPGATAPVPGGTITFGADGKVTGAAPTTPVDVGGATGVVVDMSTMTGFVSPTGVSNLISTANGSAIGTLNSFAVGADGVITGSYSNGLKRSIGQIAVASFNNYAGLQKAGGSMYTVSANSGTPIIGLPGQNGRGAILSGSLEMSNVDLSSEFTNLILAQRGFQANSRIISASDEILQDLVNLKR
ncbi:flagellar hook protein FlgE [Kineococcus gypseus]